MKRKDHMNVIFALKKQQHMNVIFATNDLFILSYAKRYRFNKKKQSRTESSTNNFGERYVKKE